MRPGDPRAGLSHASPGPVTPSPAVHRSGTGSTWPAGGRAEREEESAELIQEAVSMTTGGCLSSLEEGLPSRDCPAQLAGEAPVRSGLGPRVSGREEGVNGSPPPSFTCSPKSPVPKPEPRGSRCRPARSRMRTASPPPACTSTHDRVGLHARSELLRVSRHGRRTRPRRVGWSPPRESC